MKTKAVPSVVMLAAGGIRCVAGAINKEDTISFLWSLILTMIIFYMIGIGAKIVLDKNFKEMLEDEITDGIEDNKEDNLETLEDVEDDLKQNQDLDSVKVKSMEEEADKNLQE